MGQPRIKRDGTAAYHCIARIVAGELLLDVQAKEVLKKMLWDVAEFCGVKVLSYCLMTNHIHILVRVPKRTEPITREELLRRYRCLYEASNSPGYPDASVLEVILAEEDSEVARDWVDRLSARMEDVSEFMRTLKQRFTIWFNKTHRRFGTLWAERFKSVLIQNNPDSLRTVAAYLDLNPVRAGLVEDPAEYRWSSYGEAMGGSERAQSGLAIAVGFPNWETALAPYRTILFGKGGVIRRSGQGSIPYDKVRKVLEAGGEVEPDELLRCQNRYFSEGAVIGSPEFVTEMSEYLQSLPQPDLRPSDPNYAKPKVAIDQAPKSKKQAKIPIQGTSGMVALRSHRKDPIRPPATTSNLA